MDQASEAKFLASREDFLTLDSTSLANRNQDIKFGNGRGKFCLNFDFCVSCKCFHVMRF